MEDYKVDIIPGLRIGWWRPGWQKTPFTELGTYIGPPLGYHIIGTTLEQKLIEGNLKFRIGVLFRPDRGPRQNLETVLIVENYVPEMWDYNESWEKTA